MSTEPTAGTAPELRILIVDDDTDGATSLAYLLQLQGCRTAVAFGGDSGLKLLQFFRPSVVFLDLRMPGYDGCGLLHRAKAFVGQGSDTMFVCLTASRDDEQRALASGFDRFVHKPMGPDTLSAIVDEARARAVARGDWHLPPTTTIAGDLSPAPDVPGGR